MRNAIQDASCCHTRSRGAVALRTRPWVPALLAAMGLVGCAGPLDGAEAAFKAGRYPVAKATLASLEAGSARWTPERRAEYALYRGLTLAALGDDARAATWLRFAQSIEEARPGALSPEDARRLAVARDAVEEGP